MSRASALPALAMVLAVPACTREPLDGPAVPMARPVLVPLSGALGTGDDPVDAWYSSVVAQMREAVLQRDLEGLRGLLAASGDRAGAPEWAREPLRHFADLCGALAFELSAPQHARVERQGAEVLPLGADLEYHFVLDVAKCGDAWSGPVRLGAVGEEAFTTFLAEIEVLDVDPEGGRTVGRSSQMLRPTEAVDGAQGGVLRLPLRLEIGASGAAMRTVRVRVEALPGRVTVGGRVAPNRRFFCASHEATYYPQGVESVRRAPMVTLREALRLGPEAHARHLYLAARFLPEGAREEAMSMLIRTVRLGNSGEVRLATAALQVVSGETLPVGARDAWLEWWQRRVQDR